MRDLRQVRLLAAQAGDHARDQQRDAVAAGIHDAVLAQHRQQLRAALDRRLRRLERPLEHLGEHRVLLLVGRVGVEARLRHVRELGRDPVRHLAHDRDHRALGRVAHRRRRRRRRRAPARPTRARGSTSSPGPARQLLGRAAHDLREDHAAVAARAEQRGARDGLHDLVAADVVDHLAVQAVELLHHGPQRLRHVVARVAVGDREHVQVVDLLTACLELRTARRRRPCGSALSRDRPREPMPGRARAALATLPAFRQRVQT